MDIFKVVLSKQARKDLEKIPKRLFQNLISWIELVGADGLSEARKIPGYHDEPLMGKRWGQRSIRLSRKYRAVYVILSSGVLEFVEVKEVNKHEY